MSKLEGPKKHHNYHGDDASRPMRGNGPAVPPQHWEKQYDLCGSPENMKMTQGSDFNAKKSKDRNTTYIKVNETDH